MTRTLILQDFTHAAPDGGFVLQTAPSQPAPDTPDDLDDLDSYDAAYKSGWADCAAFEAEEQRAVGSDLAKNLTDAHLTYDTARRDVLAALGPFFEEIVQILLPKMAAAAIAPTVLAELGALAEGQTLSNIEIHASPSACSSLERLGETEGLTDLTVRPEPAFAEGQVSIRAGGERRDLDLAAAASQIAEAIAGFSAQSAAPHDLNLSQGAA